MDHKTVERWVTILENLYLCFRISPFGAPKVRAVKKERELYLWDWSMAPEGGARFENLVASQLLEYCHFVEDTEGHAMELRFRWRSLGPSPHLAGAQFDRLFPASRSGGSR